MSGWAWVGIVLLGWLVLSIVGGLVLATLLSRVGPNASAPVFGETASRAFGPLRNAPTEG